MGLRNDLPFPMYYTNELRPWVSRKGKSGRFLCLLLCDDVDKEFASTPLNRGVNVNVEVVSAHIRAILTTYVANITHYEQHITPLQRNFF